MWTLLALGIIALVQCQDHPGSGGGTGHGHLPGHTEEVAHTPNLDNPAFFVDMHMHALIMKTSSGCYVQHVDNQIVTADGQELKLLEARLFNGVKTAHTFLKVVSPEAITHFNPEIQAACKHTAMFHWH